MQAQEKAEPSKWRGWLAKKAKNLGISIAVALVIALGVRATVVQAFVATTDAVAPEVARDARVLVYKLGDSFRPGDIMVYRDSAGVAMMGRVVASDVQSVVVSRADSPNVTVARRDVVGRVILNTR